MAFVDATNTRTKLGAGIAVLAIEAGIGLALVAGLTASFTRVKDTSLRGETIITPKPPEKPPETKPVQKNDSVIDRVDPLVKLPPQPGTELPPPELFPGADGDDTVGGLVPPEITPPPLPEPPRFTPKRATPRNKTGLWVTTNDYPTNDLRAEHQGRTGYRLAIDANGAVTDCTVTSSSGWPGLDKAACDNVRRRAKFDPATDQTGARTAGNYSGSVTWQIPEE